MSGSPSSRPRAVWKRLVCASLVAVLVATLGTARIAQAAPSTSIVLTLDQQQATVNGAALKLDTAPVLDAATGRTFVPVRFIGENLGAYVGWDGAVQQVTYLMGDTRIQLRIGQKTAQVNGQDVALDAAPYVDANGRTLVPVRFVTERMGATVGWDGAARAITITAPWVGRLVLLQDRKFSVGNLTIAPGTRVTWVNLDHDEHDIYGGPGFESPTITYGQAYSRVFTEAGTFEYGCTFHSEMAATITVR